LKSVFHIAGLSILLRDSDACLAELDDVFAEFGRRCDEYRSDVANPHLCHAGCSHCCRRGAFFAVTLVEAVRLSRAVGAMPHDSLDVSRRAAESLLSRQREEFPRVEGLPDKPGTRDDAQFSARVTRVSRTGPACPLLEGDLCGVYADRPLLCRAYGFPVDAYAVRSDVAIVFRSLCQLYEGMETGDYVRAEDLKRRVREVSRRLGGGRDWGLFTSAEAILARVEHADSRADRDGARAAQVN